MSLQNPNIFDATKAIFGLGVETAGLTKDVAIASQKVASYYVTDYAIQGRAYLKVKRAEFQQWQEANIINQPIPTLEERTIKFAASEDVVMPEPKKSTPAPRPVNTKKEKKEQKQEVDALKAYIDETNETLLDLMKSIKNINARLDGMAAANMTAAAQS